MTVEDKGTEGIIPGVKIPFRYRVVYLDSNKQGML